MPTSTLAPSVSSFFRDSFGHEPDRIASAPGRVNLIGEHTDYNGGEVLPIGIDQRTYVAVRVVSETAQSHIVSSTQDAAGAFDITRPTRTSYWWDYVAGVAHVLAENGVTVPQLEIAVVSDVPVGAGLSSSAALEVAATLAMTHVAETSMTLQAAASIAWRAETGFVGVPCGIMDQCASALSQKDAALHLWCDTLRTELVPCRESILIFDTGVPRELRQSSFALRQAECQEALARLQQTDPGLAYLAHATVAEIEASDLPPTLRRRALHVVHETRRVQASVAALAEGGTIPGDLLLASHESLRDLYECSLPELDWFVEHVIQYSGIRGARLTGAGWGGCAIATGEREALLAAAEPVARAYQTVFGHTPRTWLTHSAEGARIEG